LSSLLFLRSSSVLAPTIRYKFTGYWVTARITYAGLKSKINHKGQKLRVGWCAVPVSVLPTNGTCWITLPDNRGRVLVKDHIPTTSVNKVKNYWARRNKYYDIQIDVYAKTSKKQLKKLDMGIREVYINIQEKE